MYAKAATALLLALAVIQLSTGPLLAKPTRLLAHPSARRLVAAEPVARSSRERVSRVPQTPVLARSHRHAVQKSEVATVPASTRATRNGIRAARTLAQDREPVDGRSSARRHNGPRALVQESDFRDRGRGYNSRAESGRVQLRRIDYARVDNFKQKAARESLPARAASDRSHRRTSDESPIPVPATIPSSRGAANGTALINMGGPLRPALGSSPLKSIEEEASTPVLLPPLRVTSLYDNHGHLVVPPPLYGSRENLLHQNEMADRDGINRIQDDADLLDLRREKKLVALPDNETLHVDFRLPENRRFSRPWTAAFLSILARDYYDSFHTPLQVDSAVRTVAVQQRLIRTNGNAAPSTGDTASPHLTGQAVDIAKGGLSRIQIAWMRTYLQPLIDLGKIDVEEEFQQSCFHISVYRNFVPSAPSRISVVTARELAPATLERSTE